MNYNPTFLKKHFSFIVLLVFILSAPKVIAQIPTDSTTTNTYDQYLKEKSIQFHSALDSLTSSYSNWKYTGSDTLSNPYYYPIFSPTKLHSTVLQRSLGSLPSPKKSLFTVGNYSSLVNYIDNQLISAYTAMPGLFQNSTAVDDSKGLRKDVNKTVKQEIKLSEKVTTVASEAAPQIADEQIDIQVQKPNFWTFKSTFSLKFTQNHVSDNWYKGGESNYSFLSAATIEANYDNKQKLLFNNKLEMRLGFMSSKNDDLHKFKTNDDLLRLTNKLGLQASKHWYYTIMLQSWTQFHPAYKSNDPKIYSDFMSPFESVFSVGMDYKFSRKRFTLDATISPVACRFKYVDRLALSTAFGLKEGKHTSFDYGSNITANYSWEMFKNVTWKGRIYFFTDYSKTQVEWENTFDLKINKFLSTTIFLYPRFDDSVKRTDGQSYFQFYELLSFGLELSF